MKTKILPILKANLCSRGGEFLSSQGFSLKILSAIPENGSYFFYDLCGTLKFCFKPNSRPVFVNWIKFKPKPLLKKALGRVNSVLDLTGGLGTDAAFLLNQGFFVRVVEKEPLFFEMLKSAQEGQKPPGHLDLVFGNSFEVLDSPLSEEALYMDPFFKIALRTALPKQGSQFLIKWSHLKSNAEMSRDLLQKSLNKAPSRLIVKAHKFSKLLLPSKPSNTLSGRSVFYTVYVK